MNKRLVSITLLALAAALLWAGSLMSTPARHGGGDYVEGEVLVKYRDGVDEQKRADKRHVLGVRKMKGLMKGRMSRLKLPQGKAVGQAIEELMADPDVEYAEPNYIRRATYTPAEFSLPTHWGLDIINAPGAWDMVNTCAPTIAVIDSGIANHVELTSSIWRNTGETDCSDRIDNDGNGYTDDCYGWNFVSNTSDSLSDGFSHGTHVAGTIAAGGDDGNPALGICQGGAKVMSLRILDDAGDGSVADEIEALYYAMDMDVRLANLSLGGTQCSLSERDAFRAFGEAGGLAIAAAGNEGVDNDDNYQDIQFPATYDLPYILSVAATNTSDNLGDFNSTQSSNYGYNSVDLAAPGVDISSTYSLPPYYATASGTSMAAPHVTGVAAMVKTRYPSLDNLQLKAQLMGSVDDFLMTGLLGKVATQGRLNAYNAVVDTIPNAPSALTLTEETNGNVTLSWTDNSSDETSFNVERMAAAATTFTSIGGSLADWTQFTDTAPPAEGAFYRVRAQKGANHRSMYTDVVAFNADLSTLYKLAKCPSDFVYPTGGGGGGGCFIATAAFGTGLSAELSTLRLMRDRVLMGSDAGRALVNFYYRNSPPLADGIKHHPALRAAVRALIMPLAFAFMHPVAVAIMLIIMAAAMVSGKRGNTKVKYTVGNSGFSLMEVMVVVVILGLLVAFVAPKLVGRTDDARVTSAQMQISSFTSAVKLYRNDNGFYPDTEQGLQALVSQPSSGRQPNNYRQGGYIDKIPRDPWGNDYIYISPGVRGEFDIISLGADGVEGGEGYDADITNWD